MSPEQLQTYRAADRETIRFARAILSRPYFFTVVLLTVNLFVFMLMWQSSGTTSHVLWAGFPREVLEAYGAKVNYLINAPNYQWWRFITPMFVHINLPHLLVNMYSLWIVGPYVEKLYGSAKFVVFWVLTGIAGVVAGYLSVRPDLSTGSLGRFLFKYADTPSAGASGALFGLVGVLFVFGIKFRHELPEGFKRAFGTGMIPIIAINLFIGFVGRGFIDNAAHLGGLLSGAALAAAVEYRRPGERRGMAAAWRILQVLALAVVVVAFYKTARYLNHPVHVPQTVVTQQVMLGEQSQAFAHYGGAMAEARNKTEAVIQNRDVTDVDNIVERLNQAPFLDERANEFRERLKSILARAVTAAAAATPVPGDGPRRQPPLEDQKLVDDFAQWNSEYEEWMKQAAQTYLSGQAK